MKQAVYTLLVIFIVIIVTACSDDGDAGNYQYGDFQFDMVTFMGSDAGGRGDLFINTPAGDAAATELIDPSAAVSNSSEPLGYGRRILLNYLIGSKQDDGSLIITPRGYTPAVTDSLRYSRNIGSLAMDSLRLNSIWRTSDYINLYCRVQYTDQARTLTLVMDYDTWHDDTVHCYLSHNMMGAQPYFWRRCYASFYVGAVWNLPSCNTLRVHLNDVTYPDTKYYDFSKTN